MSIHYEIDVNVALKGREPVWRPLRIADNTMCRWQNRDDARAALVDENRGDGARIVKVDDGIRTPVKEHPQARDIHKLADLIKTGGQMTIASMERMPTIVLNSVSRAWIVAGLRMLADTPE